VTTHGRQNLWSIVAATDLSAASSRFKAVNFAGLIAGSTSRIAGVLVTSAKSGERVSVVYEGVSKVLAGGAVSTLGYPLSVNSDGFFVAAASGAPHIGRATATCASGDLVEAFVNFENIPAWPGV
jgi:hypothetical protein